jgi:hypothetical protein
VTVSFRARIATRATGPLDDIYPEGGGTAPTLWPTDGAGYRIRNNGRGMFFISQNGAVGPSRLAFSLLDMNAITAEGLTLTKTGLVMNAQSSAGGPDTTSNETAMNIVEIENSEMTDWHEFWINVKALPAPVAGNTHEVNVYLDGSLEPETFQVVLGLQNEAGTGSFLSMGLTSGSSFGAFDVDFIAYKEGVLVPMLMSQGLAGDYNDDGKVDAADYVVWRNGGPLLNETETIGSITSEDYNAWRASFGAAAGGATAFGSGQIPEPSTVALLFIVGIHVAGIRALLRR